MSSDLKSGDELWKYEVGEVEMMPSRWPDDDGKEVDYTLDNYYPPVFVGNRLYMFYDGVTSFEARNGKERLREKYRVNEEGLALTEAEPIFADDVIYVSGHGRVRAISRQPGDTGWEAKDLGLTRRWFSWTMCFTCAPVDSLRGSRMARRLSVVHTA